MSPGPTYIAPSPSFFFPSGNASLSLIDYLPSRTVADRLLTRYWVSVHPVARVVHQPSFRRRYEAFWDEIGRAVEPPNALQAVVFAAMFSGAVSMPEEAILMEFGVPKLDLVNNFKVGTEMALGRANITRSTKVETLQAFVMYMVGQFSAFSATGVAGAHGSQPGRGPAAEGTGHDVLIDTRGRAGTYPLTSPHRSRSVAGRFLARIPCSARPPSGLPSAWDCIGMGPNMSSARSRRMCAG